MDLRRVVRLWRVVLLRALHRAPAFLEGTLIPTDEALAEARKLLYNLLLAPYHESSHYQITTACVYLEHPMRPSGKRCICGMKTPPKPVNVTVAI